MHLRLAIFDLDGTLDRVRAAAHLVLEEPDLRPLLPRVEQMLPGWLWLQG